jgi:hypothetical protein
MRITVQVRKVCVRCSSVFQRVEKPGLGGLGNAPSRSRLGAMFFITFRGPQALGYRL